MRRTVTARLGRLEAIRRLRSGDSNAREVLYGRLEELRRRLAGREPGDSWSPAMKIAGTVAPDGWPAALRSWLERRRHEEQKEPDNTSRTADSR